MFIKGDGLNYLVYTYKGSVVKIQCNTIPRYSRTKVEVLFKVKLQKSLSDLVAPCNLFS